MGWSWGFFIFIYKFAADPRWQWAAAPLVSMELLLLTIDEGWYATDHFGLDVIFHSRMRQ